MEEISKKELLEKTGISYGQLYRWKREGLIPEEWFVKKSSYTGQETFFPRDRMLERIGVILEKKDDRSLEEIRKEITGSDDGELCGLITDAILMAGQTGAQCNAVLFETNDGKHFILNTKDGKVLADNGTKVLLVLAEKEVRERVKESADISKQGGK